MSVANAGATVEVSGFLARVFIINQDQNYPNIFLLILLSLRPISREFDHMSS